MNVAQFTAQSQAFLTGNLPERCDNHPAPRSTLPGRNSLWRELQELPRFLWLRPPELHLPFTHMTTGMPEAPQWCGKL